jgi:hypothetical protein
MDPEGSLLCLQGYSLEPFIHAIVIQKKLASLNLSRFSDGLGRPGFDSLQGDIFSLPRSVRTVSGAHSASYPIGTGPLSPGAKLPGREAYHLSPSSA